MPKILKISAIALYCFLLITISGCMKTYVWNRALIDNPDWSNQTYTLTRHGFYHIDYLINADVAFSLTTRSGEKDTFHIIEVKFDDVNIKTFYPNSLSELSFNPADSYLVLPGGGREKAIGFTCSSVSENDVDYYTREYEVKNELPMRWSTQYTFDGTSIDKQISLNNESCFFLFFRHRPLLEGEDFGLILNGIFKLKTRLKIAEIRFSKGYFTHYRR